MTPAQPIIEAGPYTLRHPDPTDIPWIFTACQDPELSRWTQIPHPYRAGHAVGFVENRMQEVWPFMITRTESGELLGAIALKSFDPRSGSGEIGYWLAAEARGRGTMTIALAALERATMVHLGAREMVLRIAEGNAASLAVAQRAGYEPAGREPASCNGLDAVVFRKRLGPPAT